MFSNQIETIFQEELTNMNSNVQKIDSLLMEFKDVNSKYIHLRTMFAQFTKDKSLTREKTSELLKVHLNIIQHLNDINKEILDIFTSIAAPVVEESKDY